jgi:hypothetical protein
MYDPVHVRLTTVERYGSGWELMLCDQCFGQILNYALSVVDWESSSG